MVRVQPNELREFLLDENLPGIAYILLWEELDEESDGYGTLSKVLFDYESVDDPDIAPTRDLSDPKVRAGVADCAIKYPEVGKAVAQAIRRTRKPWWKFW